MKKVIEYILGRKFQRHDILLVAIIIPCLMVIAAVLIGFIIFLLTGPHFN